MSKVTEQEIVISKNIKLYRKQKGLSQTQLGQLMGIENKNSAKSYISQIENGKSKLSFYSLNKIGTILGFKADILIKKVK